MNDVVWWAVDNLKVTVLLLSVFDDMLTVWCRWMAKMSSKKAWVTKIHAVVKLRVKSHW